MEYDLKALLIQCRNQTIQNNIFFGIAAATKLLPMLASDQEPEVYLITLKKTATLNNWPREDWSAILHNKAYPHAAVPSNILAGFTVSSICCINSGCMYGDMAQALYGLIGTAKVCNETV